MKCTDCQGTGLENDNKICPNCKGFGEIGDDIEHVINEKDLEINPGLVGEVELGEVITLPNVVSRKAVIKRSANVKKVIKSKK